MDPEEWARLHRPERDPDYQRMAEATALIEEENATTGPKLALDRRFHYDTALLFGARRAEETSQKIKLENPSAEALLTPLGSAWMEGFAFGSLLYRREGRGREPEAFLDRIALANVNHLLATGTSAERTEIFSEVASTEALAYVSSIRSIQAEQILRTLAPGAASHQQVKRLIGGHWLDGLFLGLVFEELGGHRGE